MPISAVIIPQTLYEPMIEASTAAGQFGHGFTYSGHPVAAAVALKTLEIYERRNLYEHVRRMTPRFQQRLHALSEHPLVGEARGVGLVGACELATSNFLKAGSMQGDSDDGGGPRECATNFRNRETCLARLLWQASRHLHVIEINLSGTIIVHQLRCSGALMSSVARAREPGEPLGRAASS